MCRNVARFLGGIGIDAVMTGAQQEGQGRDGRGDSTASLWRELKRGDARQGKGRK